MTISELAELFLTYLYDMAEEKGHNQIFRLNDFATNLGVDDIGKIYKAAKFLDNRRLIHPVSYAVDGNVRASISEEGCFLVESGGETGVIRRYREQPDSFIVNIDQSTTVHGDVAHSNISSHSTDVTQQISLNDDTNNLIKQIIEILKKDSSVYQFDKEDLLNDIEILKLELTKHKKDHSFIKTVMERLGNVASIASLITQLGSHLM